MADYFGNRYWTAKYWPASYFQGGELAPGALSANLTGSGGVVAADLTAVADLSAVLSGAGDITPSLTAVADMTASLSGSGGVVSGLTVNAPETRIREKINPYKTTKVQPVHLTYQRAVRIARGKAA